MDKRGGKAKVGEGENTGGLMDVSEEYGFSLPTIGFRIKPTRKTLFSSYSHPHTNKQLSGLPRYRLFTTIYKKVPVYAVPRVIGQWSLRVSEPLVFSVNL
jgi:hypothetical protein